MKSEGRCKPCSFPGTGMALALLYRAAQEDGDHRHLSVGSRTSPPLPTTGELIEEPTEAHKHFSGDREASTVRDKGASFNQ